MAEHHLDAVVHFGELAVRVYAQHLLGPICGYLYEGRRVPCDGALPSQAQPACPGNDQVGARAAQALRRLATHSG